MSKLSDSYEKLPLFIVIRGDETWTFKSNHPFESRLVRLWPGDYLTPNGVRFPPTSQPSEADVMESLDGFIEG